MAINKSKKSTCQSCRDRKVRCDGELPICQRCIRGGRICNYQPASKNTISFRYSYLSSLASSQRPRSSSSSTRTGNGTLSDPGNDLDGGDLNDTGSSADVTHIRSPTMPEHVAQARALDTSVRIPNEAGLSPVSPIAHQTPRSHDSTISGIASAVDIPVTSPRRQMFSLAPKLWDRDPTKPLSSLEAEMMQFYVDEIGPWLDSASPERHFTYTVPPLALRCNVLFYSIITCAAHILRLALKRHELSNIEEIYQHDCVQLLIPMLDNVASACRNEAVLAAIGMLRMSEQWDDFYEDRQYHLVPSCFSCFDTMTKSSTTHGGLVEATFYAYIRADIRMAILGRCATKMQPSIWSLDTSTPSTDADWANRATWLLVQTINLCYGGGAAGVLPRGQLEAYVDDWKDSLPDTFLPYIYRESDQSSFPVTKVLCPWHVVGLQFYHACKILLATNNPAQPSFSDVIRFNQYVDKKILTHARAICALAFSNENFGTRINGSHLVALGAQYFTSREERSRVWKYMDLLHELHAWPSKACQDMLKQAYG